MSRIGKLPIVVSDKIEVNIADDFIEVKWPLWVLREKLHPLVSVSFEEGNIKVFPVSEENSLSRALWWTYRSLINNMVIWVTEWFSKSLEINGVWYKFELSGQKLILSIWFSHKVEVDIPSEIKASFDEKSKNIIHFKSINKQLLWEFTAKIRAMKKPEPYKGKWIKYVWENIRRKAWKSGK